MIISTRPPSVPTNPNDPNPGNPGTVPPWLVTPWPVPVDPDTPRIFQPPTHEAPQ